MTKLEVHQEEKDLVAQALAITSWKTQKRIFALINSLHSQLLLGLEGDSSES